MGRGESCRRKSLLRRNVKADKNHKNGMDGRWNRNIRHKEDKEKCTEFRWSPPVSQNSTKPLYLWLYFIVTIGD